MNGNFFSSSIGSFNSGVLTLSGMSLKKSWHDKACVDKSEIKRTAAYKASSKPYQLSEKKICPLISPAKIAWVSFIFVLIWLCPVFHKSACPPQDSMKG